MKLIIYKNIKKGFTLIELMIAVTIVGILAALAIPAYQDYAIKAQVAEGLNLVVAYKSAIADYYANKGDFPRNPDDIGFAANTKGKYVDSLEMSADSVDIVVVANFGGDEVNQKINGESIYIFGEEDNQTGVILWSCNGSMDRKYLPPICNGLRLPR